MPEPLEQRGRDTEVARSNGAELSKAARGNVAGEAPELIRQHGKRDAEAARVAWQRYRSCEKQRGRVTKSC
jgi:hypothetical protein